MKKSVISLILISAIVLCTAIALADTSTTWSPSSFVSDGSDGWNVLNGNFGGSFSSGGVYSVPSDGYSDAAHALQASSDGNFELDIPFTLHGEGVSAYVGLSTASDPQDTSGWSVVGDDRDNALGFSHGGLSNIEYFADQAPAMGTKYTAKLISSDGGKTATLSIDGYPGSTTVNLNGAPKYVIMYLNNSGTLGNSANVPDVNGITYKYDVSGTSNPSPSPSPSPGTIVNGQDLAGVRDFYAHQPVVHMSNQSVVYNVDGTIKQVITGTAGSVTAPATAPATNATKPVVTAPANATATAKPVTTTVAAPTAAPTKSQSPGFEIILAAMGMIAALALITRKKK